jgi:NCS1 family nucleobase:cation symporter-1
MGAIELSVPAQRSFYFAFITSGVGAGLTYYLLARFVPQESYVLHRGEKFQEWTQDEVETYAPVEGEGEGAWSSSVGGSDEGETESAAGMRYRGQDKESKVVVEESKGIAAFR